MKVLTGRQGILKVRIDGVPYPVLCAISVRWWWDMEKLEKTDRNAGRWRKYMTRLCDWGIELTGLTKVDNSDGQVAHFWLSQESIRGTEQFFVLEYTDEDSNQQTVSGYCLVQHGELTGAVEAFNVSSITLQGTGAYSTDPVDSPGGRTTYKLYLSTTEGAFEVSHADLGGADQILLVGREDAFYTETTGTPSGRQFKYTDLTSSGKLTFDSTIPFNAGEIVYVQFEKS